MKNLGLSMRQAEDAMKMMGEVMADAMSKFSSGGNSAWATPPASVQNTKVEAHVRRAQERGLDSELVMQIVRDVHAKAAENDMSDEWVLRTLGQRLKEAIATHVEGLAYSENEDTATLGAVSFAEKIDPQGFASWDEACAETLHVEGLLELIKRVEEAREYGTSQLVVVRRHHPGERSQCREDGILDVFAALLAGAKVLFRVIEGPPIKKEAMKMSDGWYEATGKVSTSGNSNMAHFIKGEMERRGMMGR